MIVLFVLGGLTLSSTISIRWLIVVSVFQGIVNAFDMPGRQAFVVTLIEDKRDLPNAIALNSSMFNAARLIGPSIAGGIIAAAGEGWIFLIDGFSYFAVMVALLVMRLVKPAAAAGHRAGMWSQGGEGLAYITRV